MSDLVPGGSVRRAALARAPGGLLGMLALVVLAEAFIARHGHDFLDMDDWAYRTNARALARKAKRYDVLVMGDSLAKLGVVPGAVAERSGLKVHNFAVSGSQAPTTYFLLKRVLAGGARPKGVVVDFQPPLMRLGPRHNLGRYANFLTIGETARFAWWARDAGLFATIAAGKLLPSYHRREGVRAHVKGALTGAGDTRRWYNFLAFRNWSRNAGAQLMPPTPGVEKLTDAQVETIRRGFYPKWECDPANLEGLRHFLALAAAHDVPVYWLLTPHLPALQAKLRSSGIDAAHERFIRSWQAKYPNIVVLDGRGAVNDPGAFYDANHLAARGAYAFSLALGDTLRRLRVGHDVPSEAPRWVSVPERRPGPLPAGLEDINQSGLALGAMAPARR